MAIEIDHEIEVARFRAGEDFMKAPVASTYVGIYDGPKLIASYERYDGERMTQRDLSALWRIETIRRMRNNREQGAQTALSRDGRELENNQD